MAVTRTKCRDHGGWFKIVVKPGRRPVRCSEENPCDAESISERPRKPTKRELAAEREALAERDRQAVATSRLKDAAAAKVLLARESNPAAMEGKSRSASLAQACKMELTAVGWAVKGRAWAEKSSGYAQVQATRGSESLIVTWQDGQLIGQDYVLWHDVPTKNGTPPKSLPFRADEMSDRELIQAIAGMKVTWWNSLAQAEESFTVSADKLSIEHFYASNGDEDGGRRIVKFLALNGQGFRHFYVDALLKVG